jgi:hypothetical protein
MFCQVLTGSAFSVWDTAHSRLISAYLPPFSGPCSIRHAEGTGHSRKCPAACRVCPSWSLLRSIAGPIALQTCTSSHHHEYFGNLVLVRTFGANQLHAVLILKADLVDTCVDTSFLLRTSLRTNRVRTSRPILISPPFFGTPFAWISTGG